jgi:integrase/recombinase XerD
LAIGGQNLLLMAIAVKPPPPPAAPGPGADARFEGLVLDFLSYLELERGLSRNTLNAYRTDLLQYGEHLAEHRADALKARPADIGDFLADLATGN